MQFDTSTINKELLEELPVYQEPMSYTIDDGFGSGCAGDPPGYPSYFLQHIYNRFGNIPRKGAYMLLFGHVVHTIEEPYESLRSLLHRLWVPLPYEHERVKLWIADTYRHMHSCYKHPDYVDANGDLKILTGPSSYSREFRSRTFVDDIRFSKAWRTKAKAEVDAYNAELQAIWAKIAIPENHAAYRAVKEFYPEHEPDLAQIEKPTETISTWWEVYGHRPTPENCPGNSLWGGWRTKHPVNGSWCQVCGWKAE